MRAPTAKLLALASETVAIAVLPRDALNNANSQEKEIVIALGDRRLSFDVHGVDHVVRDLKAAQAEVRQTTPN